jgi:pimeloyl-ACP methyl ester carboxylesterase
MGPREGARSYDAPGRKPAQVSSRIEGMEIRKNLRSRKARRVSLLVFCAIRFLFAINCRAQDPSSSQYVRQANKDSVIVFVHGLLGDSQSAWTNGSTKAFWPALMKDDPYFNDFDIFVVGYPSKLFRPGYTVDELVEVVRRDIDRSRVFAEHKHVYFLCHSMGGLVVRGYLTRYQNRAPQVPMIYFFSTPTTGAEIASLAGLLSRNRQIQGLLPIGANEYLASVQKNWLAAQFSIASYCAYETQDTYGSKVVGESSATNLCNRPLDPIDANHLDIVKPRDINDAPYVAFRNAVQAVRPEPTRKAPPSSIGGAAARLRGVVVENDESGPPVGMMSLSAGDDAIPIISNSVKGTFTFVFPKKKAGDSVHLHVNSEAYAVVNDFQLRTILPSDPDESPVTIIVCKKEVQEEMRTKFYRLHSDREVDARYAERIKDLEDRHMEDAKAIEQFKKERDETKVLAAEGARGFAKQDIEMASELYGQAMQGFVAGNVGQAISLLSEDKLNGQLEAANEQGTAVKATKERIAQEWLLKAYLLTLQFRVYEADHAYKKAVEASPGSIEATQAYALFKGRENIFEAQTAYVYRCHSPCGIHGPYPDVPLEGLPEDLPNAKALTGSSRALAAQLSDLIDEGKLLDHQTSLRTGDMEFLCKIEAAWQARVDKLLSPSLDPRLVEALSKVSYEQVSGATSHSQQGIAICNSIKAETDLLTMYNNQLLGVGN